MLMWKLESTVLFKAFIRKLDEKGMSLGSLESTSSSPKGRKHEESSERAISSNGVTKERMMQLCDEKSEDVENQWKIDIRKEQFIPVKDISDARKMIP